MDRKETDWEQKYVDLLAEVCGEGGSTCTQHQKLTDAEWMRRQWKNAIDHWRFWKDAYEQAHGDVPVTLEMRVVNFTARAKFAEELLAEHGIDLHAEYIKQAVKALGGQ